MVMVGLDYLMMIKGWFCKRGLLAMAHGSGVCLLDMAFSEYFFSV